MASPEKSMGGREANSKKYSTFSIVVTPEEGYQEEQYVD